MGHIENMHGQIQAEAGRVKLLYSTNVLSILPFLPVFIISHFL
jgi:hypothetical protein